MTGILRISEAASLAFHALVHIAENNNERTTTGTIAGDLDVSENHLAKVMQHLMKAGLVNSVRGPGGGFRLSKPPGEISLYDILEIIDGPLDRNTCLLGSSKCTRKECILGDLTEKVNDLVIERFTSIHLSDFVRQTTLEKSK